MSVFPATSAADNPWLTQTVRIEKITAEAAGVATYHLRFVEEAINRQYTYRPGQFNMLYLPGVGETPISLSGDSPEISTWDHTVRVVGNATRTLSQLGEGKTLGMRGPYGSSWPLDACQDRDVILVAGGIGLAPLRPAIRAIVANRQQYGRVTLLYGARTPRDLLFQREFDSWTAAGISVHVTVDRSAVGWLGNVGVVTLLLDRLRPLEPERSQLLMCGPEVMMRYTVRSALARGLTREQIYVSLERNMQCAVGLCGHCQLGPAFVCKDGPVFCYPEMEPYLLVEGL